MMGPGCYRSAGRCHRGRAALSALRQRDLAAARQAQIAAAATYAKALVDMQRASGSTLKANGIELSDALKGEAMKRPSRSFQSKQVSSVGAK